MTPEQRLDRIERIARLFVKAASRARKQSREQGEKVNMDRVERIAKLLAQPDPRQRRESREQLKKLKAMVERHRIQDESARPDLRESHEQLNRLKALVEKRRIENEQLANLGKVQKPPYPLDTNNS